MVGYSASVAINDHGRAIDLADLLIERTDLLMSGYQVTYSSRTPLTKGRSRCTWRQPRPVRRPHFVGPRLQLRRPTSRLPGDRRTRTLATLDPDPRRTPGLGR